MKDKNINLRCNFCGKSQNEVKRLVAGAGVYICNECVELCQEVIEDQEVDNIPVSKQHIKYKPKQIKEHLDQYIIGQDEAKKILSVAVYNHYKRINNVSKDDIELQKSNIVLVGGSGTGKTLLAQTLAKLLNVPFAIADATTLTEAGYVGDDVENILLKLIQNAKNDIEQAKSGIIYIDEIDKIARKGENTSITRDVSGEGVQQALLKLIEGTVCKVPPQGGRKHPNQECLEIDTSNILFICGGAFDGIEKVIQGRMKGKNTLGFNTTIESKKETPINILQHLQPNDLLKFGLIPELIGRLPIVAKLNALDDKALLRILTEPKNAIIKQYQKLFSIDNIKLDFNNEVLDMIVAEAMKRNTGARGLRAILEELMLDIMYETPSMKSVKRIEVTKEHFTKIADYQLLNVS